MNQYFDSRRPARNSRCETSFNTNTGSHALRRSKTTHEFRKDVAQKQDVIDETSNDAIQKWFNKAATPEQKVVYDFIEDLYNNAKEEEKQQKLKQQQKKTVIVHQPVVVVEDKKPEKKTIDDILNNIRCYRRNPFRRRAFYDDKKQDEIESALSRPKENLNEILMHTNISDPKFKYFSQKPPTVLEQKKSTSNHQLPDIKQKSHKFYSDTWRMFMECKPVEKSETDTKQAFALRRIQQV